MFVRAILTTIVRVGLTFAVPHFYVDAEHHVYLHLHTPSPHLF